MSTVYFVQNCRMQIRRKISQLGLVCVLALCTPWAQAAHGYALWGDLKYAPAFAHFDYVNPQAPKGGELQLVSNLRVSNFDKYNPFTMKGNAPAYLSSLLFDSLLSSAMDETGSAYGLLAQDVQVTPDFRAVTFTLNPAARFHNGKPVTAADVRYSYETLIGPYCSPAYKTILANVKSATVLDAQRIRFDFFQPNRELPLTLGALPIFSQDWGVANGKRKPFDQVVLDTPIGSGPYKIGSVVFGRDITYVRDAQYWARDLNTRRGSANFDKISVKIYKDNTAKLEALKAGEFDVMRFFSARDWARLARGKRFDSGELVKAEFAHQLPTGFQSYVFNTRNPALQDVRVRRAMALAMDFEWMNRQLFFGAYSRVQGLFGSTACQASGPGVGPPSAAELALLEPWRATLPAAVFGPGYQAPRTDGSHSLRGNLREAQALLKDAGWRLGTDGILHNGQGQKLQLEYLESNEAGGRTFSPWARNLEKLGIKLELRLADFALYQQRLQKFDFDVISLAYGGTHNPGQEYADLFGSQAASIEDSGNYAGVKSPAVDALIARMAHAQSKAELLPACRALDRVISHSYYLLGQWSANTHRMVYNSQRLAHPATMPPYAQGEDWVLDTWWAK